MEKIIQTIHNIGLVPVVKISKSDSSIPLANALIRGGIPCVEITFRTHEAQESIKLISEKVPEMLVGAGTILSIEQVDRAVSAGAKFIVSPGLDTTVVDYCIQNNILIIPGVNTPSDIQKALQYGIKTLKFFPAEASGGLHLIKALKGPFPNIRFIPSGGINETNIVEYLANPNIIACGGTWMVKDSLINERKFDQIEQLSLRAIHLVLGFRFHHFYINYPDILDAKNITQEINSLFGFSYLKNKESNIIGSFIDIHQGTSKTKVGQIFISTNSLDRACFYLGLKGLELDKETKVNKDDDFFKSVSLKNPIGGFSIHLIERG